MIKIEKLHKVFGKVQGIMFRQTLMRSCLRRKIDAAATNDSSNRDRVTFSVIALEEEIECLCKDLLRLEKLNSWGASVSSLKELGQFIEFSEHQVSTKNVDEFKWTAGVEFFL